MPRFKTIVYEETIVFDVTYCRWNPPEEAYDGGDGPGSCTPYRAGYYDHGVKKGLTASARKKFIAQMNKNYRNLGNKDRGPCEVKTRQVWKKISEKISTRQPKVKS
jgi:hypothetical protein